ncbi:helix-turn-helix domain-containing protein [Acetobacter senegalensis]|uniref:helix-turn-helix domain-containing protein n=1 Tax=Acetobacter senegalensis TaxID=446692 RepID=UPI0038D17CA1
MSVADVADRWSVSSQTVLNIIRRGHLKAIRIGSRYRVQPTAVYDYESTQCHAPSQIPPHTASVTVVGNTTSNGGTGNKANAFHLGQRIGKRQSAH